MHFAVPIQIQILLVFVALVGYVFGRRSRRPVEAGPNRSRRELRRAQLVAAELEKIAWDLRKALVRHHGSVSKFREKVCKLDVQAQDAAWKDLCREAEEILRPTLRLAAQISNAHDEIRQQSAHLMTFTEVRTDPLTGVNNRRGLDDALGTQLALMNRYGTRFCIAMFDIDHFKQLNDVQGHLYGDQMLTELARLIDEAVRETDVVARYGGEEFIVVMPETDIEGERDFRRTFAGENRVRDAADRKRRRGRVLDGDSHESMIARADAALYAAKSAGRNCIFRHTGNEAELAPPRRWLHSTCSPRSCLRRTIWAVLSAIARQSGLQPISSLGNWLPYGRRNRRRIERVTQGCATRPAASRASSRARRSAPARRPVRKPSNLPARLPRRKFLRRPESWPLSGRDGWRRRRASARSGRQAVGRKHGQRRDGLSLFSGQSASRTSAGSRSRQSTH